MSMRVPGIGSQYLFATLDAAKQYFDGGKTYEPFFTKQWRPSEIEQVS